MPVVDVNLKDGHVMFTGYLTLAGHRIQIDFIAPKGASDAVKDSLFLQELSKVAEVNYLELGTI